MGSGSSHSSSKGDLKHASPTQQATGHQSHVHMVVESNSPTSDGNLNNSNPSKDKAEVSHVDPKVLQTVKKSANETKTATSHKAPPSTSTSSEKDEKKEQDTTMSVKSEMKTESPGVLNSTSSRKASTETAQVQKLLEETPQDIFNTALRLSCELFSPDDILNAASKDVTMLQLNRAPSPYLSLYSLLHKLTHVQVLDVSGNQMGPVSFRTLMYAFCYNTTISVLNVADNHTDTDSALSIGRMLTENSSLHCLDVSGNMLGIDFFSRCVGPALATNTTLQVLRCESIGSSDVSVMMKSLITNMTLRELYLSHNEITDSHNMVISFNTWLKNDQCRLTCLELKNCGLKPGDLEILTDGIRCNKSLNTLNIAGNKVSTHQSILDCLVVCMCHPGLVELRIDDLKVGSNTGWKHGDQKPTASGLCSLYMSNCGLTDEHIKSLLDHCGSGVLCQLTQLVLTNNTKLTTTALKSFQALITVPDTTCILEKLSFGQNSADQLPDLLASGLFPNLLYLNLRKAKISGGKVSALSATLHEGVNTLVLDGLKLSGTNAIQHLLGDTAFVTSGSPSLSLTALSLSGCQMTDQDLTPLNTAIGLGLPLHMLKVAGNRLTDVFMEGLVDSLLTQPGHPLTLLDISTNKLKQAGAKRLADVLKDKQLNLRSLNVSNNCIEPLGVSGLVSALVCGSLVTLQASDQQTRYEELDMEEIYDTLAQGLDVKPEKTEDGIPSSCCNLPKLSPGFQCKLLGLGGCTGDLGAMLDSAAICTDLQKIKKCRLTFQHVTELAAAIREQENNECLFSSKEWRNSISADKDAPSWLQLSDERAVAIYLSGLPASISVQKLEGFLEMEVDCGVREIYLCKDILTRKNNGFAWALLSDKESVDKAVQFYQKGQAIVLGTSFVMTAVNVCVADDDLDAQSEEAKARMDMELRLKSRQKEDKAHQRLIEDSYYTSQKRHAYRLAHPAYADGNVW